MVQGAPSFLLSSTLSRALRGHIDVGFSVGQRVQGKIQGSG